jgi:hypothetical protein
VPEMEMSLFLEAINATAVQYEKASKYTGIAYSYTKPTNTSRAIRKSKEDGGKLRAVSAYTLNDLFDIIKLNNIELNMLDFGSTYSNVQYETQTTKEGTNEIFIVYSNAKTKKNVRLQRQTVYDALHKYNETHTFAFPKREDESVVNDNAEVIEETTKVLETKVDETKVLETKVDDTKVLETKVDETKVSETKVDETKVDEGVEVKIAPKRSRKHYKPLSTENALKVLPKYQISVNDDMTRLKKYDLKDLRMIGEQLSIKLVAPEGGNALGIKEVIPCIVNERTKRLQERPEDYSIEAEPIPMFDITGFMYCPETFDIFKCDDTNEPNFDKSYGRVIFDNETGQYEVDDEFKRLVDEE